MLDEQVDSDEQVHSDEQGNSDEQVDSELPMPVASPIHGHRHRVSGTSRKQVSDYCTA